MERDTMSFDIVCVGGGVATLSTVLRLLNRVRGEPAGDRPPPTVLILDKGSEIGAHILSGAVVDPQALTDLLGDEAFSKLPRFTTVKAESYRFLTPGGSVRVPWVPKAMRAEGYPIVSLSAVTRHLGGLCEKAGAEIYAGFPAVELLRQDGRVTGVRVGDKGVDKQGVQRSSYMPGPDLLASVVVLGEGACGFLTEQLIADEKMGGPNPQTYAIGIKELIETPEHGGRGGTILHTFGYPLDLLTYGGGFVYCLSDTLTAVGMVTALDYRNPTLNPHDAFRQFKNHRSVHELIAGGKVLEYGAKVLPEGGFHSLPGLVADGALIVGDGGGLCNSLRLKGVHLAVQSGMAAGDALFECWKRNDFSRAALMRYPEQLRQTPGWEELRRIRNIRACFAYGTIPGMLAVGMSTFSGGVLPPGRLALEPDWEPMRPTARVRPCPPPPKVGEAEANLQMDKLSDVFFSKTHHEENQPSHLKIPDAGKCRQCISLYGAPCTRFCPAQVYVLEEEPSAIRVDFANCLHCKTCQIKDPLRNIQWRPPEGGGGPVYSRM